MNRGKYIIGGLVAALVGFEWIPSVVADDPSSNEAPGVPLLLDGEPDIGRNVRRVARLAGLSWRVVPSGSGWAMEAENRTGHPVSVQASVEVEKIQIMNPIARMLPIPTVSTASLTVVVPANRTVRVPLPATLAGPVDATRRWRDTPQTEPSPSIGPGMNPLETLTLSLRSQGERAILLRMSHDLFAGEVSRNSGEDLRARSGDARSQSHSPPLVASTSSATTARSPAGTRGSSE